MLQIITNLFEDLCGFRYSRRADEMAGGLNGNVTDRYNLAEDPGDETGLAQRPSAQLTRDAK
ncbi:MAG TPA: hypothetical protein VFW83_08420 [Bryobacteraceae bacterium]|nr:hypothetical protein [Bryobacteraceae bacterium]